jgi:hypothetical protein
MRRTRRHDGAPAFRLSARVEAGKLADSRSNLFPQSVEFDKVPTLPLDFSSSENVALLC